jgi:sugar O-acyltransferase (sialic acid O-acetyltransferase NeuD family)
MNAIKILGMSTNTICIYADLFRESGLAEHLDIFMNIEFDRKPITPVVPFSYSMYGPNVLPDSTKKVVFGTSGPKNKWAIFQYYLSNGSIKEQDYLTFCHSSSYVASSSEIGHGVLIEPHVVVSSQSIVEFGVTVKRSCSIGHHNQIGKFTDLNPGVVLSGNVKIGEACILGSGVVVRDGITIGDNTIVGMGSVVTTDLPPDCIAYGSPCKVVRPNF